MSPRCRSIYTPITPARTYIPQRPCSWALGSHMQMPCGRLHAAVLQPRKPSESTTGPRIILPPPPALCPLLAPCTSAFQTLGSSQFLPPSTPYAWISESSAHLQMHWLPVNAPWLLLLQVLRLEVTFFRKRSLKLPSESSVLLMHSFLKFLFQASQHFKPPNWISNLLDLILPKTMNFLKSACLLSPSPGGLPSLSPPGQSLGLVATVPHFFLSLHCCCLSWPLSDLSKGGTLSSPSGKLVLSNVPNRSSLLCAWVRIFLRMA